MLDALGVTADDTVIVCRPELPRAAPAAAEVADAARGARVSRRAGARRRPMWPTRSTSPSSRRPTDGQVVVAGSLYVAGPALPDLVQRNFRRA